MIRATLILEGDPGDGKSLVGRAVTELLRDQVALATRGYFLEVYTNVKGQPPHLEKLSYRRGYDGNVVHMHGDMRSNGQFSVAAVLQARKDVGVGEGPLDRLEGARVACDRLAAFGAEVDPSYGGVGNPVDWAIATIKGQYDQIQAKAAEIEKVRRYLETAGVFVEAGAVGDAAIALFKERYDQIMGLTHRVTTPVDQRLEQRFRALELATAEGFVSLAASGGGQIEAMHGLKSAVEGLAELYNSGSATDELEARSIALSQAIKGSEGHAAGGVITRAAAYYAFLTGQVAVKTDDEPKAAEPDRRTLGQRAADTLEALGPKWERIVHAHMLANNLPLPQESTVFATANSIIRQLRATPDVDGLELDREAFVSGATSEKATGRVVEGGKVTGHFVGAAGEAIKAGVAQAPDVGVLQGSDQVGRATHVSVANAAGVELYRGPIEEAPAIRNGDEVTVTGYALTGADDYEPAHTDDLTDDGNIRPFEPHRQLQVDFGELSHLLSAGEYRGAYLYTYFACEPAEELFIRRIDGEAELVSNEAGFWVVLDEFTAIRASTTGDPDEEAAFAPFELIVPKGGDEVGDDRPIAAIEEEAAALEPDTVTFVEPEGFGGDVAALEPGDEPVVAATQDAEDGGLREEGAFWGDAAPEAVTFAEAAADQEHVELYGGDGDDQVAVAEPWTEGDNLDPPEPEPKPRRPRSKDGPPVPDGPPPHKMMG